MPDAQLRATLVGSQLVGLSVLRYIGRIEPLASASVDELVAAVGADGAAVPDGGPGAPERGAAAGRRRAGCDPPAQM